MPNPIFPHVHLNGTSAGSLLEGFSDIRLALQAALKLIEENTPNGRDYYTSNTPNAFAKARDQHVAFAKTIGDAVAHFSALEEHVCAARDGELRIAASSPPPGELPVGRSAGACFYSNKTGQFDSLKSNASPLNANEIANLYSANPEAVIILRPYYAPSVQQTPPVAYDDSLPSASASTKNKSA
jgi:hypothetical protein